MTAPLLYFLAGAAFALICQLALNWLSNRSASVVMRDVGAMVAQRAGLTTEQCREAKTLFDREGRRCTRCRTLVPFKADLTSLDILTHLCPECVELEDRLLS